MASFVKIFKEKINSDKALSNPLLRRLYNHRYNPYSCILAITDIDKLKKNSLTRLLPSQSYINYGPVFFNQKAKENNTITQEVHLHHFKNAVIHVASSAIVVGNKLITYRSKGERYNEGFIKSHNQNYAKVIFKSKENIKEGLFLGGNGSWNWFHFLIEIMPKLYIYKEQYTNVLLVNDIILKIPSMQRVLDIISNNNFKIKYLRADKTYDVKNLYHINELNHVQFNRFDNKIKLEGTFYNSELTKKYTDYIINNIPVVEDLPEKIFLYRKNTHRIAINQDEILDYLSKFGFVAVCLEELSLEEQISYFKNATFIIGISGAAWSNLVFCRNNPKAICFIPDNAKDFSAFSNLAKIFDVNLIHQAYKLDDHHYSSNFEVDIVFFKKLFISLHEK